MTRRVEAKLRDGCGFPDTPTDYQIYADGRLVLDGSLEHFERRHAITQIDGDVEVSIWDRACLVTIASVECRDIDYTRW
ncbi:MAG TPA: hypothetical protein VL326_38100 [Kofleriaceae bacterium]|nr:hypothetical protein [Kofleriaceae bacterium]